MEAADAKVLITCPSCSSQFRAVAAKIAPQGSRVKCPKCAVTFLVKLDGGTAVATALPGAAAPSVRPQSPPAAPAARASAPAAAPVAKPLAQPARAPAAAQPVAATPAPAAPSAAAAPSASRPPARHPAPVAARPAHAEPPPPALQLASDKPAAPAPAPARPAPLPLSATTPQAIEPLEPVAPGADALFTTPVEDVQSLSLAPLPEEEAARQAGAPERPAGVPGEMRWQLDVPEYAEQTFSMAELKNLVRDGALLPHDNLTKAGEESWVEAGEVPEIRRLFDLKEMMDRKKADKPQKAGAPISAQHPCTNHPQWEAEFRCAKCGKYFCIHCVDQKRGGTTTYYSCKSCHDLCKKVDRTYAITPFYLMLPQLFATPWKGWGPLMMFFNAGMLWISTWPIPVPFASTLCKLIVLAYLLWILKYAARGRETVPDWPDTSDVLELAGIGVRASLVTLISFAPLLIFLAVFFWPLLSGMMGLGMPGPSDVTPLPVPSLMESGGPVETPQYQPVMPEGGTPYAAAPPDSGGSGLEPPDTAWVEQMAVQRGGGSKEDMSVDARQQLEDRLAREREASDREAQEQLASRMGGVMEKGVILFIGVFLGGLFAFVYYPMSLAVTAVWHVIRPILNPLFIFRLIGRIAGQYVAFLIFFGVLTFVGWLSQVLLGIIPIVGSLLSSAVLVYIYFVTSFMLGRLCYSNDAKLGWEEEVYPGR